MFPLRLGFDETIPNKAEKQTLINIPKPNIATFFEESPMAIA